MSAASTEVTSSKHSPTLKERVQKVMKYDQTVPVFSSTALKLLDAANQIDMDIETVADIVKVDPGLTTKYLKLSNSVIFRGQSITSVHDALMRIGMDEVRKLASTIGVMDVLSIFRADKKKSKPDEVEIEWEMLWLHCLLTARLTDALSSAFRKTAGKEYLAGLLHDVGKLFLDRYFHDEFESALRAALEKKCSFYESESVLFDTNHSEIGARLCEKWNLHEEVSRSIRYHHNPASAQNKDPNDPDNQQLLATCICVADALANSCHANIQGGREVEDIAVESLPEWELLQKFTPLDGYEIDVAEELKKAQEVIDILSSDSP
jgi:putative nucleotidyltransferase with HDIG domain